MSAPRSISKLLLTVGAMVCAGAMGLARSQEVNNTKAGGLKRPEVVRGEKVFANNCAACHGAAATGGMGPNLMASSLVRHDVGGDALGKLLHEGRMDKGMPAFPQLSAAEVADIAAFLHARIDAFTRASALGASAFSGSLNVGDAKAGKQYFAVKCAACHAAEKDLAGIAKKYQPAELEGHMLMPDAGKPKAVVTAQGRDYSGTVLHRDEFTLTLKTADGQTQTWPVAAVRVKEEDALKGHRDLLKTYTDKDIHDVFAYLETLR